MVKYIISHKNPDTDTIGSSLVYANYLRNKNEEIKVIRLGELNNETKFLLEKFEFEIPELKLKLEDGSNIILVDHNESSQTIENIDNLKIVELIDHHKINLKTNEPLKIRTEVIGSTCSIITKILFENNYNISKNEAGLLLSAIISDTLYFRSPTTTNEDKQLVEKLNKIAKIENLEKFSLEMFNKKSDLGNISVEELIKLDFKSFEFNGNKFGIGFMETTDPNYALNRKDEIIIKLREIKNKEKFKGIIFSIVDILNEKNLTLFPDTDEKEILSDVFNIVIDSNIADLGNRLSRKKQIVPFLEKFFN